MILIDEAKYPFRSRRGVVMCCHMMSNGETLEEELKELHAFAKLLGLREEWFQDHQTHPHYDLFPTKRSKAVLLGAHQVRSTEMVKMYLNRLKRRQVETPTDQNPDITGEKDYSHK